MSKARDIANSTETLDVDGGTIKLDGNYPTGTGNVALGDDALRDGSLSGGNNTAIGHYALYANTSGAENTSIGRGNLDANTTGSHNTALGSTALSSSTTGSYNTALGSLALNSNTTASNNTAVGYQAMYDNTTGVVNAAFGRETLANNTSGQANSAFGTNALFSNTTASNNTAVGYQAGYSNTTGSYSTFIGRNAGTNTTGGENTFVGSSAGNLVTTGQKNTILGKFDGNNGGLDIRTLNNQIVLSDGDGNPRLYIDSSANVIFSGGTAVPSSSVAGAAFDPNTNGRVILKLGTSSTANQGLAEFFNPNGLVGSIITNGSATSYSTSSDYRLKENVVELTGATDRLKQLEPKRFNFIADGSDATVDGFLAHEVQSVVPEAITGTHNEVDADGNPVYQGIDQSKLVPLLVATIKELEARITALENA